MKVYLNFRGAEGVETLHEYDTKTPPTEADRARALAGSRRPKMSDFQVVLWIAGQDCAEANRNQPGHYTSTRCTNAWRAK